MKDTKLFLLMLLSWLTVGMAFAQTNRLYIPELKISRGSEATLSVFMDNTEEVTAVEFTLELPDGFTILPNTSLLSERATNHQITARKLKNGKYKFVILSQDNSIFKDIAGRLFSVRLQASESVTDEGNYLPILSSVVMSAKSGANIMQEIDGGRIIVKSLPNLHVVSLDCSEPIAGQTITVRWRVRNDGLGSTGDSEWKDYVWLVPNISVGTAMAGAKMLLSVDNISALTPGESYENTVNIVLDERIYGNYDLVVMSNMYGANGIDLHAFNDEVPRPYDPENSDYGFLKATGNARYVTLEEKNEENGVSDNFFYNRINIQVPPLPDLQVTKVVAEVIPVASIDDHGSYDSFVESMIPTPLTASGVAHNSIFYSGKKVMVTATIANNGERDILNMSWNNALFLSSTEEELSADAIRLGVESLIGKTLRTGETTTITFIASIPYSWSGNTYFHVCTDTDDNIYELANTANNWGHSEIVNVLPTPGADFVPYDLNVPQQCTVGGKLTISYNVRNEGSGIPYYSPWKDKIYLSKSDKGLDNTAVELGTFLHYGMFEPITIAGQSSGGMAFIPAEKYSYTGDNYTTTHSLGINNVDSGVYYVYVVVDAENLVFEFDGEHNNVIMSNPIELIKPDLTVELISLSEENLTTGTKVAVSWRLKNIGSANIQNATITDEFYAANNNDSNMEILGTATNTISLVAGGEKVLRAIVTIPKNSQLNGSLQVFVRTNINNSIAETRTNNNLSNGVIKQFVYVEDPTDPTVVHVKGLNLTVSSMETVLTAKPKDKISLSYYVKNTGDMALDKDVKQEVFISNSPDYGTSMVLLPIEGSLPDLSNLQVGASVKANVSVTIPSNMKGGQNYLFVVINKDKSLAEMKMDDNRVKSPIYIDGNLPNLVVSSLKVPTTVMTSEKAVVSWSLSNTGNWASENTTCGVYISKDATFDSNSRQVASVPSGRIDKGTTKEMTATFKLNDDEIGTRYVYIKADTPFEEETTIDNLQSQEFTSIQSPLPDLVISDLSTDQTWNNSQTVTINAIVTNTGESETRSDKWTDEFYLSEGYTLDVNKAIKLGGKTHVGKLEKNGSYQISTSINVPSNLQGYYVLFAKTNVTGAIIESNMENNRASMMVSVEDSKKSPADLVITKVDVPSRIIAGEPVTITYDIANQGEYVAKGRLRDVLYMSSDNKWDENDTMIGVANGNVNIEPYTVMTRTVTGCVTNIPEGNYYIIVRTNSAHIIAEKEFDNNQNVAQSACMVTFQSINLGSEVTVNTSGLYKLSIHSGLSGKTVGLYLSTPVNSSAGLYTAFNQVPSTARNDRSASEVETVEQELLIPDIREGDYYILAQDNAAVSRSLNEFVIGEEYGSTASIMTLSAREVNFGATSLSITEGGNKGWISTEVHGALLDSIMDFRLTRDGTMIPAESITFYDQTSSKATFNLNDAETGSYDVVSELPNGTLATLPDGFKVVPGTNVGLGVKLDAPTQTRIDGYGPVAVTYVNSGNTDIVIRELLLTITGGQLSTTIEGFKKNPQTELHIRPDVKMDNRGFVVIPPGKQETMNFYFRQTSGWTHLNLYIVK